jgi:hypothetical protein
VRVDAIGGMLQRFGMYTIVDFSAKAG